MPLRVLDPTVEPIHMEAALASRPASLAGKRVALFANGKLNATRFLDELGALLQRQLGVQVVKFNKGNASIVAPKKLVDDIASRCDLAVVAVGDWGSCSSCSMHDAITLEKRRVPAALVCTDQFIVTAQAMARIQGLPDYPFAVVPHPMGSLSDDNTRQRAEQALPQVVELLLGNGKT